MQWGKEIQNLEKLADAGMKVPALDERPDIRGDEWLWQAYLDLMSCRQDGLGMGNIPWTAIEEYARAHFLDSAETYTLHVVIKQMGIVHHEFQQKKNEQKKDLRKKSR